MVPVGLGAQKKLKLIEVLYFFLLIGVLSKSTKHPAVNISLVLQNCKLTQDVYIHSARSTFLILDIRLEFFSHQAHLVFI